MNELYSKLNVKIAPTHAGISVGPDGGSHQMLEDISLMNVDMDNGIEAVNVNGFRLDGGTLEEIKLTSEEYEQRSADIETFRKMLY